jgi:hypothetical protein
MPSQLQQVGTTFGTAEAITKGDAVVNNYDAIYVGGAGDVAIRTEGSSTTVTFKAPPVGTLLPVRVARVMSATTATLLIGLRV